LREKVGEDMLYIVVFYMIVTTLRFGIFASQVDKVHSNLFHFI